MVDRMRPAKDMIRLIQLLSGHKASGLAVEEIAAQIEVSPRTAHRFLAALKDIEPDLTFRVADDSQKRLWFLPVTRTRLPAVTAQQLSSLTAIASFMRAQGHQDYAETLQNLRDTLQSGLDRAALLRMDPDLEMLVSDTPDLVRELLAAAQGEGLSDNLVELMMTLPRSAQSVRLARLFDDEHDLERFMEVYRFLTGEENLRANHSQRLYSGERPDRLLEGLYLALPFPDPVIASPGLRHIRNGEDLVSTSKAFRNCLGNFVAEGLRGDHQYYIWSKPSAPEVVVCIRHEAPFGWYLAECQLAENERVPLRLKKELKALLAHCGIRTAGSVENLMRPYRNAPDEIDINLMFDLDAA